MSSRAFLFAGILFASVASAQAPVPPPAGGGAPMSAPPGGAPPAMGAPPPAGGSPAMGGPAMGAAPGTGQSGAAATASKARPPVPVKAEWLIKPEEVTQFLGAKSRDPFVKGGAQAKKASGGKAKSQGGAPKPAATPEEPVFEIKVQGE